MISRCAPILCAVAAILLPATAFAQGEVSLQERFISAGVCGPILEHTIGRLEQPGVYDVKPEINDGMVVVFRLSSMLFVNFVNSTGALVKQEVGGTQEQIDQSLGELRIEAEKNVAALDDGRLSAALHRTAGECAKVVLTNSPSLDTESRAKNLKILDQLWSLYTE